MEMRAQGVAQVTGSPRHLDDDGCGGGDCSGRVGVLVIADFELLMSKMSLVSSFSGRCCCCCVD